MRKTATLLALASVQIRMDATNILNHPGVGNPTLDINNGNFGLINAKDGSKREFRGSLRLNF